MKRWPAIAASIMVWLLVGAAIQWPIACLIVSYHAHRSTKTASAGTLVQTRAWPLNPLPGTLKEADWPEAPALTFEFNNLGHQRIYAHMFPRQSRPDLLTSITALRVGLPWRGLGMWRAIRHEGRPVTLRTIEHGGFHMKRPAWLWAQGADLPFLPLWPGFALNTAAFAAAAAGARIGLRAAVHARRRHLGACPGCGYSRASLAVGAACPECGRLADAAAPRLPIG